MTDESFSLGEPKLRWMHTPADWHDKITVTRLRPMTDIVERARAAMEGCSWQEEWGRVRRSNIFGLIPAMADEIEAQRLEIERLRAELAKREGTP